MNISINWAFSSPFPSLNAPTSSQNLSLAEHPFSLGNMGTPLLQQTGHCPCVSNLRTYPSPSRAEALSTALCVSVVTDLGWHCLLNE